MGAREYLFTSESVTEGHPDKVADQISDAILDAHLSGDPKSRVACETLVTTGLVVIAGEITSKTTVHYQEVARRTIKEIGYEGGGMGFRLGRLRRGGHHRQAEPGHSHGSQRGRRQRAGCRRPGTHVRLRLQPHERTHANAPCVFA